MIFMDDNFNNGIETFVIRSEELIVDKVEIKMFVTNNLRISKQRRRFIQIFTYEVNKILIKKAMTNSSLLRKPNGEETPLLKNHQQPL